jgi:hypothetical protein
MAMKRHTVILPLVLPCLNDKTAAQFVDLLHQLVAGIEYHYADQAHRYRKQQQEIAYTRHAPASNPTDAPF